MNEWDGPRRGVGGGGGTRDWWTLLLVCVRSQGQPPCHRNVRGHGGAHGRPRGPVSQLRPPAEQQRGKRYRKMHLRQSEMSNDAWKESVKICVSQAPTTVRPFPEHLKKKKKKFEDVATKSMTCVQMAKMYSYFKSYTPSGRCLIDILNPLGKIHIKNRGGKNRKEIHLGHWQQRLKRIPLSHGMSLKSPILRNS